MEEVKSFDDPYGLQKLQECDMVELRLERSCCSHLYSVSSHAGTLFTSKGIQEYRMYDRDEQMVMDLNFKRPWFQTPYMVVQVVNCLPMKVLASGGISHSMLIVDECDQTRLKIKKPILSFTHKILGVDDMQVGWMKKGWGDYDIHFPLDLEVRFKAAVIASCICLDLMARVT